MHSNESSNNKRFPNRISMPSLSTFVTSSAELILNHNIDCQWGISGPIETHVVER